MSRAGKAALVTVTMIVTSGMGLTGGSWTTPTQAGLNLEVQFDGGYIYRLGGSDAVEVVALADSKPHPHPMRVKVLIGNVSSGPNQIEIKNARLEFWPDGTAPAKKKPVLPAKNTGQTGCNPTNDRTASDNLFFLPDLAEAAAGMGTTLKASPTRAASMLITGGGRFAIDHVSGCVEYRYPDATVYGPQRSMASGESGIYYNWNVPTAKTMTLRITPRSGQPTSIVITPVNGVIQLEVGSHDPATKPTVPSRIAHFDTFYAAFESIAAAKKLSLWWVLQYEVSPGIDCPSGGDPGEPGAWP